MDTRKKESDESERLASIGILGLICFLFNIFFLGALHPIVFIAYCFLGVFSFLIVLDQNDKNKSSVLAKIIIYTFLILGLFYWATPKDEYLINKNNIENVKNDMIILLELNEEANSLKENILELREIKKKLNNKESALYKNIKEEEEYYLEALIGVLEMLLYEYGGENGYELSEYNKNIICQRFIGSSNWVSRVIYGY